MNPEYLAWHEGEGECEHCGAVDDDPHRPGCPNGPDYDEDACKEPGDV